ncbi:hypothetical protein TNCV_3388371 [Trichonephila clavipes]|nr:hypothetical protein TNCV_3388371 [Trichonephila clavipes]
MSVVRSSITVDSGVSYISNCKWLQKKKSKGLKSWEQGGKTTSPPRPINLPGYVAWRYAGVISIRMFKDGYSPRGSLLVMMMMIVNFNSARANFGQAAPNTC